MPPKFFNVSSFENILHQQELFDALEHIADSPPDYVTDKGGIYFNLRHYRSRQETHILPTIDLRVNDYTDIERTGRSMFPGTPIPDITPVRCFEVTTIPKGIAGFSLALVDKGGDNTFLAIDTLSQLLSPRKHASRIAQLVVDLVQKLP